MNQSTTFGLLDAALAELDDPARTTVVNAGADAPRFELFHAGLSICSQKARVVLAEHATPYVSHEMVIVASKGLYSDDFRPAENYRPGFVRLRLLGGAEARRQRLCQQSYRQFVGRHRRFRPVCGTAHR